MRTLKSRRVLLTWIGVGFAIPVGWLLWQIFGWPQAIRISRETTYVTKVTGDLQQTYRALIEERYTTAGSSLDDIDPWIEIYEAEKRPALDGIDLTRYRCPFEEMENDLPQALTDEERSDKWHDIWILHGTTTSLPWRDADYPNLATSLRDNSRWFSLAKETFHPISTVEVPLKTGDPVRDSLNWVSFPSQEANREFTQRFHLRAANNFGNGK